MSNIVKTSDLSGMMQSARENGVKEMTISVPEEYVEVTNVKVLGYTVSNTTTTRITHKSITIKFD